MSHTTAERSAHLPSTRDGEPLHCILFDLDGVLTPTDTLHRAAWRHVLTDLADAHGVRAYATEDYYAHIDGKPRLAGVEAFARSRALTLPAGSPMDPPSMTTLHGIAAAKNDAFHRALRTQAIEPYPDALVLLEHLRRTDVVLGVVSSSRNAGDVLRAAGLAERFRYVLDGHSAHELGLPGKPAPDTYLHAAAVLGQAPQHTAVVEDATSGVQAGAAGGFGLVFGVDRGAGEANLRAAGADRTVRRLAQLVARR